MDARWIIDDHADAVRRITAVTQDASGRLGQEAYDEAVSRYDMISTAGAWLSLLDPHDAPQE